MQRNGGKTTLTANLAATYAAKGKQVLVVDLDFQASLTGCCLGPDAMRALKQDGGKWIDNVFKADADPMRSALSSLTRVNTLSGKATKALILAAFKGRIKERKGSHERNQFRPSESGTPASA